MSNGPMSYGVHTIAPPPPPPQLFRMHGRTQGRMVVITKFLVALPGQ